MESTWDNVKKGLLEGIAAATGRVEELTQLGRARLDIAAAKTSIYRLQAKLGSVVHDHVRREDQEALAGSPIVQELSERIALLEEELKGKKDALAELQAALADSHPAEEIGESSTAQQDEPPTA